MLDILHEDNKLVKMSDMLNYLCPVSPTDDILVLGI